MRLHTESISSGDRILIVDDQIDTGGQFEAACRLINGAGGIVVGGVSEGVGDTEKTKDFGFAAHLNIITVEGEEPKTSRVWILNNTQLDTLL